MAKMFVRVTQTYYKDIIMDIHPGESADSISNRVHQYVKEHGAGTVIDQGGELSMEFLPRAVQPGDEDTYECID